MLSIVIPCYNHLDLTTQIIRNIEETQDIEYELILINDGSTDDTMNYLEKVKKSNRIVHHQENKGVNAAWNRGMELASGDYIAILNNDIVLPPGALKKMMDGFTDNSIMMVCPRSTTNKTKDYGDKPFYFEDHIHGWCYMVDKRAKTALFPIDSRLKIFGGDNWLYFKMIYMGYKLKLVKDVVIHHLESQTVDLSKNLDRPILFQIAKEEGRYVRPCPLRNNEPVDDLVFGLY